MNNFTQFQNDFTPIGHTRKANLQIQQNASFVKSVTNGKVNLSSKILEAPQYHKNSKKETKNGIPRKSEINDGNRRVYKSRATQIKENRETKKNLKAQQRHLIEWKDQISSQLGYLDQLQGKFQNQRCKPVDKFGVNSPKKQ